MGRRRRANRRRRRTLAREQQWLVHRGAKPITEDRIGSYEVPLLTIQTFAAHLILDPIARYVGGASGRIDLCVFPSYEYVLIVRTEAGWQFVTNPPTISRPGRRRFLRSRPNWPESMTRKQRRMERLRDRVEYRVALVAAAGLEERLRADPSALDEERCSSAIIRTSGITWSPPTSSACSRSSRPGCVKLGNSHSAEPPARACAI